MKNTKKPKSIDNITAAAFTETTNAEHNFERYSADIFPQPSSVKINESYEKIWKINAPKASNEEIKERIAEIKIVPMSGTKRYTSHTYEVYIGVLVVWSEQGQPNGEFEFPLIRILKHLGLSDCGINRKKIMKELLCLNTTNVFFKDSFKTYDEERTSFDSERILVKYNYITSRKLLKDSNETCFCKIQLSEKIIKNIKNNITIPTNIKVRKSIKGDVPKILYTKADHMLIHNYFNGGSKKIEWNSATIIREMQMKPKRYQYLSQKKTLTERLANALNNKETGKKGFIIFAESQPSKLTKDYKLVLRLKTPESKNQTHSHRPAIMNLKTTTIESIITLIEEYVGDKGNRKVYKIYATHYSYSMVQMAIGETKEIVKSILSSDSTSYNLVKLFTAELHKIAHKNGLKWTAKCKQNPCKYSLQSSSSFIEETTKTNSNIQYYNSIQEEKYNQQQNQQQKEDELIKEKKAQSIKKSTRIMQKFKSLSVDKRNNLEKEFISQSSPLIREEHVRSGFQSRIVNSSFIFDFLLKKLFREEL